jgi:hypothetical protein
MKKALIAIAATAVFGAASAADDVQELSAKASEILSKYDAGEGVKACLPISQIDSIKPLQDRMLLVEANGKFYLNETPGRCNGASHGNRRLQYSTSTPELCRGQIITVIDNTTDTPVGSCALGDFHALIEKPAE